MAAHGAGDDQPLEDLPVIFRGACGKRAAENLCRGASVTVLWVDRHALAKQVIDQLEAAVGNREVECGPSV